MFKKKNCVLRYKIFYILLVFLANTNFAQQLFQFNDAYTRYKTDRYINKNQIETHTAFKPLLKRYVPEVDSIVFEKGRDSKIISKLKHPKWWQKLRTEDLLLINEDGFYLAINPVFDFSQGKDNLDSNISINTRGISIKGNLGKKVSFKSDFYENQAFFPQFIREYSLNHRVVPGQGRLRGFKTWGFDYANASGYLSYSPAKWLNISLGHGKHFIGEGYRSLLLSDQSFNYPYLKFMFQSKKWQYIFMLTSFQAAQTADTRMLVYNRKHGSFLYLNYIFNKYFQAGLFEGVMFKTSGSGYNNRFPAMFFVPVIFSRSIAYGLDNEHNVLLGINGKLSPLKSIQLYGQFALDDAKLNKYAYQTGVKFFDFLWLKNLYLQMEYNFVRPYTYSHIDVQQNWSFYNEAFAASPGTGFTEKIIIASYRLNDFIISFKMNDIYSSTETADENYGINIFKPDNTASTGIKTSKIASNNPVSKKYYHYKISYLVNPATNFQVFFEYTQRKLTGIPDEYYYFFGIKTQLRNLYYDY